MTNNNARCAKRIVRELHNLLAHVPLQYCLAVAKGQARVFKLPQKVMLKAMSRYVRIHRTN